MKAMNEFTESELKALIPQSAYKMFADMNPDEFEYLVKYNIDVDTHYKKEVLLAYSYYEAMNERERRATMYGLSNLTSSHLMNFIGQNNEKLLDRIEQLFDKGIPVIEYLERQIVRVQAMILVFDESLKRSNNNVTTNR